MREDGITLVFLTKGRVALIDSADAERVLAHKWSTGVKNCAQRSLPKVKGQPRQTVLLHRFILGDVPKGVDVDHINGNRLDNRRCNLRKATRSQNAINRVRRDPRNTSGYRGVTFNKPWGKWVAKIGHTTGRQHLGGFQTAEEAARAYDEAALRLFGEFAQTNF